MEDFRVFVVPPCVRGLVVTDSHRIVEQVGRMNNQREAVDTIASEDARQYAAVLTCGIDAVGIFLEYAVLHPAVSPCVRRINIGYIDFLVEEQLRIDVEAQNDDAVASVYVLQGVVIQTRCRYKARSRMTLVREAESHRVTFANLCADGIIYLFPYIDMYVADTVISVNRLSSPLVIACLGDVVEALPCERRLVVTDIDGVFIDLVGLVDAEAQAVYAVATVDAWQNAAVFSGDVQAVGVFPEYQAFHPAVRPEIRCVNIRYVNFLVVEMLLINVEVHHYDAVATVADAGQRVAVNTRLFEEARYALNIAEAQRVAFTDRRMQYGRVEHVVVNVQRVDAVQIEDGRQRVVIRSVNVMVRNGKELLVVRSKIPYMRQRPVNRRADSDRVTEDMCLVNREADTVNTVATVDARHQVGIFACRAQCVFVCRVFSGLLVEPCVAPVVGCFAVGDRHALVRYRDPVAYIQLDRYDTVATVKCRQRVAVTTLFADPALVIATQTVETQ